MAADLTFGKILRLSFQLFTSSHNNNSETAMALNKYNRQKGLSYLAQNNLKKSQELETEIDDTKEYKKSD